MWCGNFNHPFYVLSEAGEILDQEVIMQIIILQFTHVCRGYWFIIVKVTWPGWFTISDTYVNPNEWLEPVQFKRREVFTEDRFSTQEISQQSKQNRGIRQRQKSGPETGSAALGMLSLGELWNTAMGTKRSWHRRQGADYIHKGGGDNERQVLHIREGWTMTTEGKYTGTGGDLKLEEIRHYYKTGNRTKRQEQQKQDLKGHKTWQPLNNSHVYRW